MFVSLSRNLAQFVPAIVLEGVVHLGSPCWCLVCGDTAGAAVADVVLRCLVLLLLLGWAPSGFAGCLCLCPWGEKGGSAVVAVTAYSTDFGSC